MQRLNLKIDDLHIEGNSRDGITHRTVGDVSMTVEDVPPVSPELTADEKQQLIKDMCIQKGRDAFTSVQDVNWNIGRLAVIWAKNFAVDDTGNIDAKKLKKCLREYAVSIGAYDNTGRVTQCYNVCAFWPEDAQERFKDVSWQRFQVCAKHCRDLNHAIDILNEHGEAPVAKVREAILGKPTPRPVRVELTTYGVSHYSSDGPRVIMDGLEQARLHDMLLAHPGARVTVTVEY